MNNVYTEVNNDLLFGHNGVKRTAGELASLQLKVSRFRTVFERTFAPHCSFCLPTLEFRRQDHVLENLERFESFSLTELAPFEHFFVLINIFTE